MISGNDKKDNEYFEIEMNNGESIRLTKVKSSWSGSDYGVRIQIRETNGKLRMGPEIPSINIESVIDAMRKIST